MTVSTWQGGPYEAASAILMLHGYSADKNLWLRFSRHFVRQYRVIIPDLAGHGETGFKAGGGYDIPLQAKRMIQLLDVCGVEKVHVIGNSMGGYIAFEIMRQAPERVAKLALMSTQARPDTPEATARRRGMIERARSGQYRDVVDELFPGFVHPSRQGDASLRQIVYDMSEDVGAEAFIRQQNAVLSRPDSRPSMAWIKCPTLVLTSDTDNTVPNSLSDEMANGIPGAKLVVLADCGHLPQLEQPQACAEALVQWLRN